MMIEGLRQDSLMIFGDAVRISQLLAGLILVACVAALIYFAIKKLQGELYFRVEEKTSKKAKK